MSQTFKFFNTFLDLKKLPRTAAGLMKHKEFREFVLESKGKTLETVKLMAPYLIPVLCKPQRLLYDADEYYIAQDTVTNTYYICFKELCMIDIDFHSDVDSHVAKYIEWLNEQCEANPEWRLAVFRSRKGLHVFILHTLFPNKDDMVQFQHKLKCDFYYSIFTYLRGTSVRLNCKSKDSQPLYSFICNVGNGREDEIATKLVKLHFQLQKTFIGVGRSQMK